MGKVQTNRLSETRVVIVRPAAEPNQDRLFIGLPDSEYESPISDGMMMAQHILSMPDLLTTDADAPTSDVPAIDMLEFVPLFSEGDVAGFFEWLAQNGMDTTGVAYEQYFCDGQADAAQTADWDELWQKNQLGSTVFTRAFLFSTALDTGYRTETYRTEYAVPEKLAQDMTAVLEEKYGAGNVFVSKQIQPEQVLIAEWHEFYSQAKDQLVDGQSYRRGIFDGQELPAKKICAPLYGFMVSVRKDWARVVKISEYEEFIQNFEETFLPHRQMMEALDDAIPNISNLILRLASLPCVQNHVVMFLKSVTDSAYYPTRGLGSDGRKGGFRTWVQQKLKGKG